LRPHPFLINIHFVYFPPPRQPRHLINMSNVNHLPALNRQETDTSYAESTAYDKGEKGEIAHRENRLEPLGEEDEGGNVGTAEYEKSKHMEMIVSPCCDSLVRSNADADTLRALAFRLVDSR
jgi:hypothetical protein